MKDLPREKRIYLAIWRKAWKDQADSLVIKMPDYNTAMSVRMSMYRTIKPYRNGDLYDDAIKMASDKYVLALQRDPPAIVVRKRLTTDAAEDMMTLLGIDEADLMTAEEAESLTALTKVSDALATGHQVNPFFNRGED
jgi:hypothetical protein